MSIAEQVFETPQLISEFKQYKKTYQKERDIEIDDFLKKKNKQWTKKIKSYSIRTITI